MKRSVPLLLLILLVAEVLLPNSPLLREIPARDAGVFLYMGQQILAGKVPYRDLWDHKPPVAHYLNALALGLAGGSRWGVWLLEFAAVGLLVALLWTLLRRAWGTLPAFLSLVMGLVSLPLALEGGNFTEEYALPLQALALGLFGQAEERGRYGWRGVAMGMAAGLAFFLRQNLVGVWLAVVLYLLITRLPRRRWRRLLEPLATMAAGAAVVFLLVFGYFAAHRALGDLWAAAFRYNLVYSGASLVDRLRALAFGLAVLAGISAMALAGWAAGWRALRAAPERVAGFRPLLLVLLLDAPIEILAFAPSGRTYPHYTLVWLPAFILLTGFLIHAVTTGLLACRLRGSQPRKSGPALVAGTMALLLGVNVLLLRGPARALARVDAVDLGGSAREVVAYIRRETAPSDAVLLWGNEPGLNFVAQRRCPTRFINVAPLVSRGYSNAALAAEFLGDLRADPPRLIVDTSPTSRITPPLDAAGRAGWAAPDAAYGLSSEMEPALAYIAAHYRLVGTVGPGAWPVYEWAGEGGP